MTVSESNMLKYLCNFQEIIQVLLAGMVVRGLVTWITEEIGSGVSVRICKKDNSVIIIYVRTSKLRNIWSMIIVLILIDVLYEWILFIKK